MWPSTICFVFALLLTALCASPVSECDELLSCSSCVSDRNCGWCAATRKCSAGVIMGPLLGNCTATWDYGTCTPEPEPPAQIGSVCVSLGSCESCLSNPSNGCGWCAVLNQCHVASATFACKDGSLANVSDCALGLNPLQYPEDAVQYPTRGGVSPCADPSKCTDKEINDEKLLRIRHESVLKQKVQLARERDHLLHGLSAVNTDKSLLDQQRMDDALVQQEIEKLSVQPDLAAAVEEAGKEEYQDERLRIHMKDQLAVSSMQKTLEQEKARLEKEKRDFMLQNQLKSAEIEESRERRHQIDQDHLRKERANLLTQQHEVRREHEELLQRELEAQRMAEMAAWERDKTVYDRQKEMEYLTRIRAMERDNAIRKEWRRGWKQGYSAGQSPTSDDDDTDPAVKQSKLDSPLSWRAFSEGWIRGQSELNDFIKSSEVQNAVLGDETKATAWAKGFMAGREQVHDQWLKLRHASEHEAALLPSIDGQPQPLVVHPSEPLAAQPQPHIQQTKDDVPPHSSSVGDLLSLMPEGMPPDPAVERFLQQGDTQAALAQAHEDVLAYEALRNSQRDAADNSSQPLDVTNMLQEAQQSASAQQQQPQPREIKLGSSSEPAATSSSSSSPASHAELAVPAAVANAVESLPWDATVSPGVVLRHHALVAAAGAGGENAAAAAATSSPSSGLQRVANARDHTFILPAISRRPRTSTTAPRPDVVVHAVSSLAQNPDEYATGWVAGREEVAAQLGRLRSLGVSRATLQRAEREAVLKHEAELVEAKRKAAKQLADLKEKQRVAQHAEDLEQAAWKSGWTHSKELLAKEEHERELAEAARVKEESEKKMAEEAERLRKESLVEAITKKVALDLAKRHASEEMERRNEQIERQKLLDEELARQHAEEEAHQRELVEIRERLWKDAESRRLEEEREEAQHKKDVERVKKETEARVLAELEADRKKRDEEECRQRELTEQLKHEYAQMFADQEKTRADILSQSEKEAVETQDAAIARAAALEKRTNEALAEQRKAFELQEQAREAKMALLREETANATVKAHKEVEIMKEEEQCRRQDAVEKLQAERERALQEIRGRTEKDNARRLQLEKEYADRIAAEHDRQLSREEEAECARREKEAHQREQSLKEEAEYQKQKREREDALTAQRRESADKWAKESAERVQQEEAAMQKRRNAMDDAECARQEALERAAKEQKRRDDEAAEQHMNEFQNLLTGISTAIGTMPQMPAVNSDLPRSASGLALPPPPPPPAAATAAPSSAPLVPPPAVTLAHMEATLKDVLAEQEKARSLLAETEDEQKAETAPRHHSHHHRRHHHNNNKE